MQYGKRLREEEEHGSEEHGSEEHGLEEQHAWAGREKKRRKGLSTTGGRVIGHLDVDCFYAQCEELLDPTLVGKPVGVKQKYLLVTCNYVARALGVKKMSSVVEALAICPELIVVNGEDLGKYRASSAAIYKAIKTRIGAWKIHDLAVPVEKLVLDELYLDLGPVVDLVEAGGEAGEWFEEIRGEAMGREGVHCIGFDGRVIDWDGLWRTENRLAMGCVLLSDLRASVRCSTGFTTSGGVGDSKQASKIAGNTHKPDALSVMAAGGLSGYLAGLDLGVITGVGHATRKVLFKELGIRTVAELRKFDAVFLASLVGPGRAEFLVKSARGIDASEVVDTSDMSSDALGGVPIPKSLSVEDSFRICHTWADVCSKLFLLAGDATSRLVRDAHLHRRRPSRLRFGYRLGGNKRSTAVPSIVVPAEMFPLFSLTPVEGDEEDERLAPYVQMLIELGMKALRSAITLPFSITLLRITASSFVSTATSSSSSSSSSSSRNLSLLSFVKREPVYSQRVENTRSVEFKGRSRMLPSFGGVDSTLLSGDPVGPGLRSGVAKLFSNTVFEGFAMKRSVDVGGGGAVVRVDDDDGVVVVDDGSGSGSGSDGCVDVDGDGDGDVDGDVDVDGDRDGDMDDPNNEETVVCPKCKVKVRLGDVGDHATLHERRSRSSILSFFKP